ncbi:hypothetical protein KY342_04870 [Candidatus Woesearchaeota archaeon]|nr:hypothetical protein [Candidatus Woesearchaeota archaeon]
MAEKSKYAQAGVDFEKEHDVVGILKALREATLPFTEDLREIGISFPEEGSDFSSGFKVNAKKLLENGIEEYVAQECVDGPSSKPAVHALYDGDDDVKLGCTSICSIAMVANDLICSGARPVTLTEYHSWHNINTEIAKQMAKGNLIGAEAARATITGGENASLSALITGPIPEKGYDMCHIAHGIILDRELIDHPLGKGRVKEGDIAIGLSSSGVHCNGITLIWKTAIDFANYGFDKASVINQGLDDLGESVASAILTPTIIYVKPVLELLDKYHIDVKAIANITGEGVHNMRRVLASGLGLSLDYSKNDVKKPHTIFKWVQNKADVSIKEMYEDYNMGTGMVIVADKLAAPDMIQTLNSFGQQHYNKFSAYELGKVVADKEQLIKVVTYNGKEERFEEK